MIVKIRRQQQLRMRKRGGKKKLNRSAKANLRTIPMLKKAICCQGGGKRGFAPPSGVITNLLGKGISALRSGEKEGGQKRGKGQY